MRKHATGMLCLFLFIYSSYIPQIHEEEKTRWIQNMSKNKHTPAVHNKEQVYVTEST